VGMLSGSAILDVKRRRGKLRGSGPACQRIDYSEYRIRFDRGRFCRVLVVSISNVGACLEE
jgi:hypothetical protein